MLRTKKYTWIVFIIALNIIMGGCKDDEEVYVSMNRSELAMTVGEQYQFKLSVQGDDYAGPVTWSVEASSCLSIDQNGKVIALSPTINTNNGYVRVKATIKGGRYALANVSVSQRSLTGTGDKDMAISSSELYMVASSEDSLFVTLSDSIIKYFIDDPIEGIQLGLEKLKVEVDKPDCVSARLVLDKSADKQHKIYLETMPNLEDQDVMLTLSAGGKNLECIIHIGMHTYLSFEKISTALGLDHVNEVLEKSYAWQISNTEQQPTHMDTIQFYIKANPDDDEHLAKMPFKIETTGDHVFWLKEVTDQHGQKGYIERINRELLYIYAETGLVKGSGSVKISALGKSITANIMVSDRNDLVVKSCTFKKSSYTTETNISLLNELKVKPVDVIAYWPAEWSSSDESIATVETGMVVFKKSGKVTITAKVKDLSTSCEVTGLYHITEIGEITNKTTYSVGESVEWNPIIKGNFESVDFSRMIWTSSNPEVGVVENSVFTAKSAGTTTITLSVTDDFGATRTKDITITVSDINIDNVTFTPDFLYDNMGIYQSEFKPEVYNSNDDNAEYYSFMLKLTGGIWNLSQNRVYTVGTDISTESTVKYNHANVICNLVSGTVRIENKNLTFDVDVKKGSKVVHISGSVLASGN